MDARSVRLRPKAYSDLIEIHQYTCQVWGADKADEYIDKFNQAFLALATNQALGRDRSEVRASLRAYPVGSHIVFYLPTLYGVAVVRVLHKAMDYFNHL